MLEPVDPEQPLEQPLPGIVVRLQEIGEVPLRQHDHLEELFGGHPQQPADLQAHVIVALGHHLPTGAGPPLEQRGRVHPDTALAATFRSLPGRGACDPEPPTGQAELQPHPRRRAGVGVMRAQVAGAGA